jgi:excinuclease ABC subunit A
MPIVTTQERKWLAILMNKLKLVEDFTGKRITILAPVIRARKGHYESNKSQSKDFKSRVNGQVLDITAGMKLDRYKTHDIEIVVDRMVIEIHLIMKSD